MEADDLGPDDFDIAYRDTIKGYAPGVPAIATMTRTSPTVIYNQANINMPKHVPSIKMLRAVLKITGNLSCLDVLERENGRVAHKLPDFSNHGDAALLEIYARINKENGDLAHRLSESLKDGRITLDEYKKMNVDALELVAVILEFMSRVGEIAE